MQNKLLKNRKFIFVASLFIFFGAAHQMIFSRIPLKDVPQLLSTMRAKEFCSCYFMLHKGKDYCLDFVKKGYPVFDFSISEEEKMVTFSNPLGSASAKVIEQKFGCTLI